MKKVYLSLLLCCINFAVFAQTTTSYTFTAVSGAYSDINATGILTTAISTDDAVLNMALPFTFNYCGTDYTTISICSNGWVALGNTSDILWANEDGPGTLPASGVGLLMPFFDDADGTGRNTFYLTSGSSPNRVFTFEWKNWRGVSYSGSVNYQVKLYETSNIIEFVYGATNESGSSATIGIANSLSDFRTLPDFGTSPVPNGSWTTLSSVFPASGQIYRWCPAPPPITGNIPMCTTLTLSNPVSGGTWTSGNLAVATVGAGTGIVSAVSAGNATITYTPTCGSAVITVVTVNPAPLAPAGNTPVSVCSTITLTDASGPGTWTSGNTGVATVGLSTGVVTGVAAGTANITFTLTSTGCTSIAVVTVTAMPAITSSPVCLGLSSTFTHSTPGGSWTSSNSGIALAGISTGLITGIALGSATITYTVAGGCFVVKPVTVSPLPTAITGTAVVCVGSTTSLSDATLGGTWSSSNTALATIGTSGNPVTVTGVSGGVPTITYTSALGCPVTTPVTVNSVPPITGGGGLCIAGTLPLADVGPGGTWSSGNTLIATVGTSGIVTGVAIGTANISYTLPSTGCSVTTPVTVTATPTAFAVTGGGPYCSGGIGVHVGLANSGSGVSYRLFNGATIVTTIIGTGTVLDFGLMTATGTYTVVANPGSTCQTNMTGSVTISINPLPTAFSVTGGGSYCSGGSGVHVGLTSSTIGTNYQLYYGASPIGAAQVGTGSSLDLGLVTSASPPNYTIIATNATTFCTNTMAGNATVSISSLPATFAITGGGSYCLGGSGVPVGLAGSAIGISYQLYQTGSPLGAPVSGTGSAISFGLQTGAGTYSVIATNTATGCRNSMSGPVVVTINPLPTVFTVTGGGAYCMGGTGVAIGLNGSTIGVNYQLYVGATPVGGALRAGTGVALNFPLQTVAGSYTVVATNTTTACTNNMFGSASVTINPLPAIFAITGGGGYCAGGSGVHVGLGSSAIGTNYQLLNGLTVVGGASGTGAAIDFGIYTAAGTYSVVGTDMITGCSGNMSGSVTITVNPLPNPFTVTGGGNFCDGGAGVAVGLSGSNSGINYQLYNGVSAIGAPIAGTGTSITFGLQTLPGSYTVVATNATTTCTNNMTGSANIVVNPLPTTYAMTGGGGYCAGGTGVLVGLEASNAGINYQLLVNSVPTGPLVPGTGFALSFGLQTTAGTYTVTAINPATACSNTMSGTAIVVINSLPTNFTISGSGNYCLGGTGVAVLLGGSTAGVNYQLYNGITMVGSPMAGTGFGLNFGPQTAAGTYTVVATNAITGCSRTMTGSAVIGINPLPTVFTVAGGGSYCAGGPGVHVTLSGSVSGTTYQLYNSSLPVGAPVSGTGAALDFGFEPAGAYTVMATITATGCTNNMSGSVTISLNPAPALYTISGGGSYCPGGSGLHVGQVNSAIGVNYQLYKGAVPIGAPISGTGAALDFGLQLAAGTYSVIGTDNTTGCTATMTGSTTITILPLPALHNVTGGGGVCAGGPGVSIGVDNSNTGISYQLYTGGLPIGSPVAGITSFPIDFGVQTVPGLYTVIATNTSTGCSTLMTGSAVINLNSAPLVFNVTGGGNYCAGGTGVNVGLTSSTIGVNYQLFAGLGAVGAPVPGTGLALNFGPQTIAGPYTVVATNATTGCSKNMNGTALVGINSLPALHTLTGGGNYCTGGTGIAIGLDGSDAGIKYQLFNGFTAVGGPVTSTGGVISFGLQTLSGTYTVVATNPSTTCSNTMLGVANVNVDPLPGLYTVSGGGHYCSGTGGVTILLSGSDPGINYQLFNGLTAVGVPQAGTNFSLSFGGITAAGTYTIVATDAVTGCINTMTGSVVVSIDPLPTTYLVTGGGIYCASGSGLHVYLSGSNVGITYQLYNGFTAMGAPLNGTGIGLDFGLQTAGGSYTVVATNSTTTCTNTMTGSATITINPLPAMFTVVSTSSNYCIGGAGVDIALTGSAVGTTYQLYNGTTTVGSPIAGTGAAIDFGYLLPAGAYTVVATITATGCSTNMAPGVTITVNPLPIVYTVTGGGQYCGGGAGVHIGLSGSSSGVNYQLYRGINHVGSPVNGTGAVLDFGLQTTAGTYTVVATSPSTTCTSNMSGSATIIVNPTPVAYTVTGGGNYCAGGAGIAVGLSNSTVGVNYQLFRGLTAVGTPVAGTSTAITFGLQTGTGNYTVVATDATTGCTGNMTGFVVVATNSLPPTFTVTGGGGYCPGGSGVHVGVSGSTTGINYQLYNGLSMVGSPIPGSGSGIDFGLQTVAGTYTVKATNTSTGCSVSMSGTAMVVVNTLPVVYNVVGGGSFCAGGTGVHVGLNNSTVGVNYTLFSGIATVGTLPGTGGPLDFGFQTMAGNYTVLATDATTTCSNYMSGSVAVVVNPVVTPFVTISTSAGDTVCSGTFSTFTALPVNGGSTPSYQWTINGMPAGSGSSYSYIPLNGDMAGLTMTSTALCAVPAMVNTSKTMTVQTTQTPSVNIAANPGEVVCQGTTVTYTAAPSNGGSSPAYVWKRNGLVAGSSSTYVYVPANNDIITAELTSSYHCRTTTTVVSNSIKMEVNVATVPVVTITANPDATVAPGQLVTLSAFVVNGGPTPGYQWLLNGSALPGANMATYTSTTFNDGDSVSCEVQSSGGCSGLSGTNSVIIHIKNVGVKPITYSGRDIQLLPNPNKGTFTVKGTLGTASEEATLELTNMLGQVIYTSKVTTRNGEINEKIQLNSTPANGMYILNLRSAAENKVFHIVVEQ